MVLHTRLRRQPNSRSTGLEGDLAAKLLGSMLAQPRVKRLLSTDHFSVDADRYMPDPRALHFGFLRNHDG